MNHLELTNETLVKKISTKDVSGFFSTSIDVPPGTKSLVFENGRNCGEMGPGHYTLQSFMGKLFLKSKNQVIYSFRDTCFKIDYSTSCLTKECLRVAVNIQMEYAIENTTLFVQNLMGGRDLYTLADFNADTDTLIFAAIQEVIAQYSIKEIGTGESKQYLITSLEGAVRNSLSRYGVRFKNALLLSISHEKYDAMKEQKEELWLVKEGNVISKEEREAKLAARFDEITDQEKLNDLEILEKQVRNDRNEGELAVAKRRLEYNKNLRKVVQADEFDKLANQSEMEQFLFEQDKTGILREEEKKELLQGIDWAQEEKEVRRQQFLKKLDIQFQHELEEYQTLLLYQSKLAALDQEKELNIKREAEARRQWIAGIEQEEAERKALHKKLDDDLITTEKEWSKKIRDAQGEESFTGIRVNIGNMEADAARERHEKDVRSQIEERERKFQLNLKKLQELQKLGQADKVFEMDLAEREANMEAAKEAAKRDFIRDIIQSLKGMDLQTAQMIVTSTIAEKDSRDSIIKQLEIYSKTEVAKAEAQAQSDASKVAYEVQSKANEDIKEMMKEMMSLQERNADRLVQMNSKTVDGMSNMNNGSVVVTPGFPPVQVGGNSQGPAPEEKKVLLCPQCRAEVNANQKFCPNCGKQL
ncbi:MAG: zinc-ribbon domain-containing protein [Thermoguttaceae bacterium]|nr:zinc-ribbon domain-containing protein [Thermoguttaceae bacterium]